MDGYLFGGGHLLITEYGDNLPTCVAPGAFPESGKVWGNKHAHIVSGSEEADTPCLMYALSATSFSGHLTGSTMPKLTQANMNRISPLTPPLPKQPIIARSPGTLDDKIELNPNMGEMPEAVALFQSWFLDFDPVRTKMGSHIPASRGIAKLYPGRLIQRSELGQIPEGVGGQKPR